MGRILISVTLVVLQNLLLTNAEKYMMMIPPRQIRRSPNIPIRVPTNLHSTYLKPSPYGSYGAIRPGMPLPQSNQLPLSAGNYLTSQDGFSHYHTPYGKGSVYSSPGRGYFAYDKFKGGYVPSVDQSRYSLEAARQRLQPGPAYGPTSTIYHRPTEGKYFVTDKNGPIRVQQPPRPAFPPGLSIGNKQENSPIPLNSPQSVALPSYLPSGLTSASPRPTPGDAAISVTQSPDLLREGSSVIGKVPIASPATAGTTGAGHSPIVVRDSILLDDYEKRVAEFTQSWPKLSAFPGAFSSASSFLPGSPLSQSFATSSNVARNSDNPFNSIGRKGYAVKEEIDEPPIDFRTMPIITSPLHYYPTPKTPATYSNALG